ncbi:class I SAM-dependent methyltransferase [Coleofasciculus sp.]|uniref:class I SAM-dependent methyltransferase n=1 Tax=Coleofasciculus sp. TaxID=3100458 RepID=UPI003A228B86
MKIEVLCPVCDSNQNKVKYEPWIDIQDPQKLYGAASGVPGTQRLVECEKCGMIYETPRFPDPVILQGYLLSEESGHDSQYPMRVESFYRTLLSLGSRIPAKGATVLDIGTAGGAFLEAAQRFGYQAVGLEPSQFLVEQGKKRGLNIEQGTLDNHPFQSASFDLICLWDVIEHLTRPKAALEQIQPLLKPGGILLINYPDIGTWQAKLADRRFWWIISVHLHHFTRHTLSRICQRTGWEVFHFQPYWQTLQFGYLEDMAILYKIPLSRVLKQLTPRLIQQIPIPYYASQTTALARVKP